MTKTLNSTRVLSTTLFASAALALAAVGCAAPTEGNEGAPAEEKVATENTATRSEALIKGGGGSTSSGGASTCDSRWQSCYISCGGAYGRDPTTRQLCENLCDEIHSDCGGVGGGSSSGGIIMW